MSEVTSTMSPRCAGSGSKAMSWTFLPSRSVTIVQFAPSFVDLISPKAPPVSSVP